MRFTGHPDSERNSRAKRSLQELNASIRSYYGFYNSAIRPMRPN